jgi:hypothetical protein
MAYTVNITKTGSYKALIYVATISGTGKLHLEQDGKDISGILSAPDTKGYQNWQAIESSVKLEKGSHLLKIVLDHAESGLNLDKMVFTTN